MSTLTHPELLQIYTKVGPFIDVGGGKKLAVAYLKDKSFHILTDGKPAYSDQFDDVDDFINTGNGQFLAVVRLKRSFSDMYFYIRPDGTEVCGGLWFDDAERFAHFGNNLYLGLITYFHGGKTRQLYMLPNFQRAYDLKQGDFTRIEKKFDAKLGYFTALGYINGAEYRMQIHNEQIEWVPTLTRRDI